MSPVIKGFFWLHSSGAHSSLLTKPPPLSTNAAPAATSHSCLGVNVNVRSAKPAATRANLYATEPIGCTLKAAASKGFHSLRFTSLRLASTTAPSRLLRWLARADFPLYNKPL